MLGNGHVQFGERVEETDQLKGWNRASVRLHAQGRASARGDVGRRPGR